MTMMTMMTIKTNQTVHLKCFIKNTMWIKIWIFNSYYDRDDDIHDYSDNITGITMTLKLSATVIPWSDTYTSVILSSFTDQLQNPPVCNTCLHEVCNTCLCHCTDFLMKVVYCLPAKRGHPLFTPVFSSCQGHLSDIFTSISPSSSHFISASLYQWVKVLLDQVTKTPGDNGERWWVQLGHCRRWNRTLKGSGVCTRVMDPCKGGRVESWQDRW